MNVFESRYELKQNLDKLLVVIIGPTGIGKTDLALHLTRELPAYIISADSRQVYKEMSIGTAKPSSNEILEGRIQLVNHCSITNPYNAAAFANDAQVIINSPKFDTAIPLVCGGTGLYVKALCEGLDDLPHIPDHIRNSLTQELAELGLENLQAELLAADPEYYNTADIQNPVRLIRALEVYRSSGQRMSHLLGKRKSKIPDHKILNIILELPREELYTRINTRVDRMFENGLVAEVERLIQYRKLKALATVGYAEVFRYLDGDISMESCRNEIKKNTRRYAKRQMTWCRNQIQGLSFHPLDYSRIAEHIKSNIIR